MSPPVAVQNNLSMHIISPFTYYLSSPLKTKCVVSIYIIKGNEKGGKEEHAVYTILLYIYLIIQIAY